MPPRPLSSRSLARSVEKESDQRSAKRREEKRRMKKHQQLRFYDDTSSENDSDAVSSTPPPSPRRKKGGPHVVAESPEPRTPEQVQIFQSLDNATTFIKRRREEYQLAVSANKQAKRRLEEALTELEGTERREKKLAIQISSLIKILPLAFTTAKLEVATVKREVV